jgi:hypothetical protein
MGLAKMQGLDRVLQPPQKPIAASEPAADFPLHHSCRVQAFESS